MAPEATGHPLRIALAKFFHAGAHLAMKFHYSIMLMQSFFSHDTEFGQLARRNSKPLDAYGREFYANSIEEYEGHFPEVITEALVHKLLDPSAYLRQVIPSIKDTITSLEKAIGILQAEVIPQIPDVQRELERYVEGYKKRHLQIQARDQSWVPNFVQDAIWGKVDPIYWNPEEVEVLPVDGVAGGELLRQVPTFLEHMQAHFSQLSQWDLSDLPHFGYSTMEDFKRLYAVRVECSDALLRMHEMQDTIQQPFLRGAPRLLPRH